MILPSSSAAPGGIPFATTLAGYGIGDAYTKTAADARYAPIAGGSGIVTVGALASGSIASGFGTISGTGLITASAGATIASGQTLTLAGATVAGSPMWSAGQVFSTVAIGGATIGSNALAVTGTAAFNNSVTINSGGLTVSSGTSALQEVTATGVNISTSGSAVSALEVQTSTTTANVGLFAYNQTNGLRAGVESSAGGTFATGTSAYAAVVGSTGPYPLQFFANSVLEMSIASGGIVTMSAYGAGAATFNGSGVISSASDERLKHVWGTFGKSMKDIPVNLRNVMIEYGWPDEMGTAYEPLSHYIGQSAQKLQLAVPELVHSKHVLDPKTGKLTDTGRLSVFNPGIDALLWNTAADHESRLAKLEAQVH